MANAIFRLKLVRDGGSLDGLPVIPETGDFDVTRGVDTAAANARDVSAATLQSALEALGTIGAGNIAVASTRTGIVLLDTAGITGYIQFTSNFFTASINSAFTAASIKSQLETAVGSGLVVTVTDFATNKFIIEFGGAYENTNLGEISMSGSTSPGPTVVNLAISQSISSWLLTFQSALANTDINDLSVTGNALAYKADTITVDASVTDGEQVTISNDVFTTAVAPVAAVPTNDVSTASVAQANEVQQVDIGGATTGTFDLNGNSTSDTVATLDTTGIQDACDTIWGSGNTTVASLGGDLFSVTFGSAFANTNVAEMTVTANTTNGTPIVTTTTEGNAGTHQQDTCTFDTTPVNGSMTYAGQSLGWNTNASTLTIAGGTASGTPASGSVVFTWTSYNVETPKTVATNTLLSTVGVHQVDHCVITPTGTDAGSITYGGESLAYNADGSTLLAPLAGDLATLDGTPASGLIVGTWDDYTSRSPYNVTLSTLAKTTARQVATVSLADAPTEGTLKVTVNAVDSDAFAYNADATAVNTALDAQSIAFTASGTAPNWTFTADVNAANVTFTATEVTALRKAADIIAVEVQAGTALTAPTSFTATAVSSSQINLAWTDNTSDETGFEIERSPAGEETWTAVTTTAANAVSYSNTGLDAATEYDYRVRAVNADGDGPWSSTATDTTDAASAAALSAFWFYF